MIPAGLQEISPATVDFNVSEAPFSRQYQDYYFSHQGGLQESHYVFLQGNNLPENWQNKPCFTIVESGFGSGLNFLMTWQAWKKDPARCQCLHFISVESQPLSPSQIRKIFQSWPELHPLLEHLLAAYPIALAGVHRLSFEQGNISLTLYFSDIQTLLAQGVMIADAWYLDGFAPNKNTAMWSLPVFRAMAALSHEHTTLATFTAASSVRRALQQAGFVVSKRPGYGKKREMLVGSGLDKSVQCTAEAATKPMRNPCDIQSGIKPWYALPEPVCASPLAQSSHPKQVTVLGAGIAGCQVAYSLAQRGWQVTILERHSQPAGEASGNPAGIVVPKMTAQPGWGERFYRQAFLHAVRQLNALKSNSANRQLLWQACGTLQLNHNERELRRWQALQKRGLPTGFIQLVSRDEASSIAGINLPYGASYFPQAGYLHPASLCTILLSHPQITVCLSHDAWEIKRRPSGHYQVLGPQQQVLSESTHIVLANGRGVSEWLDQYGCPLSAVAGQSSQIAATAFSTPLQTTLGHEGYITPAWQQQHFFGASFERDSSSIQIEPERDQQNYQQLKKHLPELAKNLIDPCSAHAAIRMTTPDRLPYVGPLPDTVFFKQQYATLRHGHKHSPLMKARYQPGLFVLAGLGSRGLTISAYCAEILASIINHEPLPVERALYEQLQPARFLIKRLRQTHLPD